MRHWRFGSALTIIALSFGSIIASATGAAASPYSMEQDFVAKINAERTSRGLSRLVVKSDLRSVARNHSADMAAEGDIWHNPNLSSQVGGSWTILGENVGMGGSVNGLHDAFMDSPGHRANVLHQSYNQVGVGVKLDGDGTIFVTEVFAKRGGSTAKKKSSSSSTAPAPAKKKSSVTTTVASSGGGSGTKRPAARTAAPTAKPRNVDMLVQLLGLDAADVDPATGQAMAG